MRLLFAGVIVIILLHRIFRFEIERVKENLKT